MFARKKTPQQLEQDFFQKARKAARVPGYVNKQKAREAYDRLPKGSRFKNIQFEGKL